MVGNWTIAGGKDTSFHHVTPQGAMYAERNIHGTMGNLLNSFDQNRGYLDQPIRKRLTNGEAESIAQKNQHGTMGSILHTQNYRDIISAPPNPRAAPRLMSSDAFCIQNRSLNGSMGEILNNDTFGSLGGGSRGVSGGMSGGFQGSPQERRPVRATTDVARHNVEHGTVGSIGALVLNPASTNISSEREKFANQQRNAAAATNIPPPERVRTEAAEHIATRGKYGTYGILHGGSSPNYNDKLEKYNSQVKQSFTASQSPPKARTRNAAAEVNMNRGSVGTLGVLLQGAPTVSGDQQRDDYNKGVERSLSSSCIQPPARVKPEASEIAEQHKGLVQNLIIDKPNKPKAHVKPKTIDQKNYTRLKKKEREGRKKLEVKEEKPLWKNSRYDGTESRLKQWMEQTYGGTPRKPSSARPSSAQLPAAPRAKREQAATRARPESARPSRQRRGSNSSTDHKLRKSASQDCDKKNFIVKNAKNAWQAPVKIAPSKIQDMETSRKKEDQFKAYKKGIVPDYLQSRVAKWKEEERQRIANLPDPTVPPGHVVMDAKEKEETLGILLKSRDQLTEHLQNLPLRNDTLRLHNTRIQLESKLSEIDDAIKIFSRPRVFIKQE